MEYLAEVEGQPCYIFLDFAITIFVKAACNFDANFNANFIANAQYSTS